MCWMGSELSITSQIVRPTARAMAGASHTNVSVKVDGVGRTALGPCAPTSVEPHKVEAVAACLASANVSLATRGKTAAFTRLTPLATRESTRNVV